MPWQPLPRIAFAVATFPFHASSPADLPLELGDELYIIEQGGRHGDWFRGYLIAPPSLLAGLTTEKGQALEARVFSGIFPRSCVDVREVFGDGGDGRKFQTSKLTNGHSNGHAEHRISDVSTRRPGRPGTRGSTAISTKTNSHNGDLILSVVLPRDLDRPKPQAPVPMLKIGDETPTSASEPLVDEIASCLREWHSRNLHALLLRRDYVLLDKMSTLVRRLDMARKQILHNVLTTSEIQQVRERAVWDLVNGNKAFNHEVIVRDPAERGRLLTGDDSAIEITKLQSMMSLLQETPQPPNETSSLHHLLVEMKACSSSFLEATTLVMCLVSRSPVCGLATLSESYFVRITENQPFDSLLKSGQTRTLFTDLSTSDVGDNPSVETELHLVVMIRQELQIAAARTTTSRHRGSSRDGQSLGGADKRPPVSSTKSSRRSMIWGKGSQRGYPKYPQKFDAVSENGDRVSEHRESRPSTAGSQGTQDVSRTESTKTSATRTIGVGVMNLDGFFRSGEGSENVIDIWTPSSSLVEEKLPHGKGWENIIQELLPSKSGSYKHFQKLDKIHVYLHPFASNEAETLIKNKPTVLSDVLRTSKIGFSGAPTKSRSDIYFTIDEALLPRHALLARPTGFAIPMSSSLACTNLQLTLEVRRSNGQRIDHTIFQSSNDTASSSWESPAVERGELWSQTLRLVVPASDVANAHVVMLMADLPGRPFAFSYMPLWDHQAFVRDGHHSLLMYKYDEIANASQSANNKTEYLKLPWSARSKDDGTRDEAVTGPMAILRLDSYLCSTRLSQDKVLLGILRWREQNSDELPDLLRRMTFVPEIEIVKLLDDVFDAIFGILVEHSGKDEVEDLAFNALVIVLGIVHDRRFNLEPLVDHYTEKRFKYPFAAPCLVRSFTRLLVNASDPETSRKLRATFKVVRHILKFIAHARIQQKEKEAGIGITTASPGFARNLRGTFKALDDLMRSTSPILVGSQTLAVQHFHTWVPELRGLLATDETLQVVTAFLDACGSVKGKLILYKLVLIINCAGLELFSGKDQKGLLGMKTVAWIGPYWGRTNEVNEQYCDQVRLCCSVVASQTDILDQLVPEYMPKVIDSYMAIKSGPQKLKSTFSLLFPTNYPFPTKSLPEAAVIDEALVELSATLAALSHFPNTISTVLSDEEIAMQLETTLYVHVSLLEGEAFPASWLSVHVFHHRSTMRTLQVVAQVLQKSFLPDPDSAGLNYNTDLWKLFFITLLKLVGSDVLALETFSEQKRRAIWKIAGDVREHGADLLGQAWEAIGWETDVEERRRYGVQKMGGYQVQYVPALVRPMVELCLSVHEGLRHVAVKILQTMIASEWNMSGDLQVIQTEMIDALDRLFTAKPLTESVLQKLFINELLERFENLSRIPDDPLYAALQDMVAVIDEYLTLLVSVHANETTGEVSNLMQRLRLMEFLRDMQKEEIFIRYVHQLAGLQVESRNFTEAGLVLRLHADLYKWDPNKNLPALTAPVMAAQSDFERKESIYFDMIRYFEEGEAWSSALDAYKQLQEQYEGNTFDFAKLARTQRSIATIHERIAKSERPAARYFRVSYRGMGFPSNLREKDFIFEGLPTDKVSTFADRLQEQHPSAQIIMSGESDDVEGQFLRITSVTPHRDLGHPLYQRSKISQPTRDYILSTHPRRFSTTVRRSITGPVMGHWTDKMFYETQDAFPSILRHSEIVAVERIRLGAVESAIERISRKSQELNAVQRRVTKGEEDAFASLVDLLSSSTSQSSESNMAIYHELLPSKNMVEDDTEEAVEIELTRLETALKMTLLDHALLLKHCLGFLENSTDHQLRARYDELNQDFEVTYASELAMLNPPTPREPTPVPSWTLAPTAFFESTLTLPLSQTNGTMMTMDTSILDTPSHRPSRADKTRMSFLNGRQKHDPPPLSFKAPVNGSNGAVHERKSVEGSRRSRSRSMSIAKDALKRRSMLGGSSNGDVPDGGGDGDWVTESGADSTPGRGRLELSRHATSGTMTTTSEQSRPPSVVESSVARGVGNVRKRFSMLKLGKKSNKTGVAVDSVLEE